jgi:hypothetical protein
MNTSIAYLAISIGVVAIVAILVFLVSKGERKKRLTPLAGLAFGFVLAGILFGDDRLVGYGLMGVGVVLAIIAIFPRSRKAA